MLYSEEVMQEITVKDGDTVWSIANYYLKDPKRWPEILKYNNLPINDPSSALPGMKLKIPVLLIKQKLRKATLVFLQNGVRFRKKGKAKWLKARRSMSLFNDDGLRTMDNSKAHVNFYEGDFLKLDENSLAILRPELKFEEVNLLIGTIQARKIKLITPTAHVTPKSKDTVYKATIRNDQALVVQVEKGNAEVFGVDTGETVLVKAGYANITLPDMAPSKPVRVPIMSDFKMPKFDLSGNLIPQVMKKKTSRKKKREYKVKPVKKYKPKRRKAEFSEYDKNMDKRKKIAEKKYYRLQFSKDSDFSSIVLDVKKELTKGGISKNNNQYDIPDGKYYRRVSYIDENDVEGKFISLPTVEMDRKPPTLQIDSPPQGFRTSGDHVIVEGKTEKNVYLTINDLSVPLKPNGRFYWFFVLGDEGANKIKIVAEDRNGNITKAERTVFKQGP